MNLLLLLLLLWHLRIIRKFVVSRRSSVFFSRWLSYYYLSGALANAMSLAQTHTATLLNITLETRTKNAIKSYI